MSSFLTSRGLFNRPGMEYRTLVLFCPLLYYKVPAAPKESIGCVDL